MLSGLQLIFLKESIEEKYQANGSNHGVKENDSWYIKLKETETTSFPGK